MKQEKILTVEQKQRKDRLRFRLFVLLILIDIFMVIYLVYEILSAFSNQNSSTATALPQIIELFKSIK